MRQSFERLFARYGLPQAIRSDNGAPFASVQGLLGLSRLSVWWVALGIDLERGRPGHPQDNGAHERLHRDISRELEASGQADQAALDLWRQSFNYERPHEALGMRCPGEVYVASERPYEGTPEDLDYPQMCRRRVCPKGMIRVEGARLFLTTSLAGWSVGLRPVAPERMEVWFGRLYLGVVDLATSNFIRADIRPNKIARRQIHHSQIQAPEPNFHTLGRDRSEADRPAGQTGREEQPRSFDPDHSLGADPPSAHLGIIQVFRCPLVRALRSNVDFTRAAHPQSLMRPLIIEALPPQIQSCLIGLATCFQLPADVTVKSLMGPIVLRMSRPAPFQIDPQRHPPNRKPA